MRKKGVSYRDRVFDLVKDCNGWEAGKTSKEIAWSIYGKSDEVAVRKTLATLRALKTHFIAQRKVLHCRAKKMKKEGREKREFRWFLVDNAEEAWHADDVLVLRIDRHTRQLKLQMPLLENLLTEGQKIQLIKRLGFISMSLQLPPGETVEVM